MQASKGYSLHIGLNRLDPNAYFGWDGEPSSGEADARAMKAIADSQGFRSKLLPTEQATIHKVTSEIEKAAKMKSHDIFLLTYSGHGDWIRDKKDPTKKVAAWDLYDGQLSGDELFALWGKFKAGARILVISDSCHSGTVTYVISTERGTPPYVHRRLHHESRQESCQLAIPPNPWAAEFDASVLLISACQDNQKAHQGPDYAVFTAALLDVWDNGKFQGDYWAFYENIMSEMLGPEQTPNFFLMGANYQNNRAFVQERPFKIQK